ncbi:MAG: FAD-dependent oxidoreductase [Acidimicrobiia bacterium]
MNVVIIGGVAGGMSCATRLRRLDENAQITVIERGEHVSFANCGLPYFAGGVIEEKDNLLLQTPQSLKKRFNIDVKVKHEVIKIKPESQEVVVKNIQNNVIEIISYDKLVLSMGAAPFIPPMEGSENLITLRNIEDLDKLVERIQKSKQNNSTAIVIGAGFIGLEVAENLKHQGLEVTLIELANQVLPPLDKDMAYFVERELISKGISLKLGLSVTSATQNSVKLSNGETINADLLFASIGVRPEIKIAQDAGIEIGKRGGVVVNNSMQTNMKNIYAVGDMVEKIDALTGDSTLIALANIANKQGRRAADSIAGIKVPIETNKSNGTAVVKVFDLTVAMTGQSSKRLENINKQYTSIHIHPNNHAGYYPGAKQMHLVVHIDPITGEIFGAQGVGPSDVARRIDVISTAMRGGIKAQELIDIELAYAPQYGSAKDAINMIGYIAEGIVVEKNHVISVQNISGQQVLDVRTEEEFMQGHIPGSLNIEIDQLRERHSELNKNIEVIVTCQVGQRGHSATKLLRNLGYDAYNLDGGYLTWSAFQGQH